MYIKLKTNYGTINYLNVIPTCACYYRDQFSKKLEFYYFSEGQFFSYSGYNYKFSTLEDVVKLLEDMMVCERAGQVIYDVDAKLVELGITLGNAK